MSDCPDLAVTDNGLLARLQDLLKREPDFYDVVFCVGPEKKLVKGLKVILKAASSVLEREFNEKWEVALVKEGMEISLPDLDPNAFELFIKLLMLDTWCSETLTNLNLPPDQVLSLLKICKRFGVTTGQRNLEKIASDFIRSFGEHNPHQLGQLLEMSPLNLETFLASDDLAMEELPLYEFLCRWGEKRCKDLEMAPTTANLRQVLGKCLYEIRFPLMSVFNFTTAMQIKKLLTTQEILEIYQFIGLKKREKSKADLSKLGFKAKKRTLGSKQPISNSPPISTLCLTKNYDIINNPPFVCDGCQEWHGFASKERIEIHGLGFLGPINQDANYDVGVEIQKVINNMVSSSEKRTGKVFAKKGKTFRVMFDKPIMIERGSLLKWVNYYIIYYNLKGPNTRSVQRPFAQDELLQEGKNEFRVQWCSNQLAEILFKKL